MIRDVLIKSMLVSVCVFFLHGARSPGQVLAVSHLHKFGLP
jgi:hypothetical protein